MIIYHGRALPYTAGYFSMPHSLISCVEQITLFAKTMFASTSKKRSFTHALILLHFWDVLNCSDWSRKGMEGVLLSKCWLRKVVVANNGK